jgi:hypothetical protein
MALMSGCASDPTLQRYGTDLIATQYRNARVSHQVRLMKWASVLKITLSKFSTRGGAKSR